MSYLEKEKLAIDVGGVLIEKKELSVADPNFDPKEIRWLPGALDAIDALKEHYDLYILSFCGKKTEKETREALKTKIVKSIPKWKWIFTREPEYKVDRMTQNGIKILIDDTLDIVNMVKNANLQALHYGSDQYPNWHAIVKHLLSDV